MTRQQCRRHKCTHDQATQVKDMAVCDICGRECEAWNLDDPGIVDFGPLD